MPTDEAWNLSKDPAILRLQPSYRRLWMAHAAIPLLGAVVLLLTRDFDLRVVEPHINSFLNMILTINIQGTAIHKSYPLLEARREFCHKLACAMTYLWAAAIAFHLFVIIKWGLSPLMRRLRNTSVRLELAVARVSSRDLLSAILRPHLQVAIAGCLVLFSLGALQLFYLHFRYSEKIPWNFSFYTIYCSLGCTICFWSEFFEDFEDNLTSTNFRRRLREYSFSFLAVFIWIAFFVAYYFAVRHAVFDLIPSLVAIMIVVEILFARDLRRRWRMLCASFAKVE